VNHIERAWFRRALGPIPFVPLAARHMHALARHALGAREAGAGPRHSSGRVALHRISWAMPAGDAQALLRLLLHGASLARAPVRPVLLSRSHEVWELLNFRAAVLVPWDWETTTFVELYRLALPLLVPDDDFMSVLIWRTMRQGELRRQQRFIRLRAEWWRGAPCHTAPAPCAASPRNGSGATAPAAAAAPPPPPPWLSAEPGLPTLREQIRWWYGRTDYRRFPHVGRFHGLADLLQRIGALDARGTARRMRSANAAALRASSEAYGRLLLGVL